MNWNPKSKIKKVILIISLIVVAFSSAYLINNYMEERELARKDVMFQRMMNARTNPSLYNLIYR